MSNDIQDFRRFMRSRTWAFRLRHWFPTTEQYRRHAHQTLIDYFSTSPKKQRRAARQWLKIATIEVGQYHNLRSGLSHATASIDLRPTIAALTLRAQLHLYMGNWQAALNDLAAAGCLEGSPQRLTRARYLEAWCQLTYQRTLPETDEALPPATPHDQIAQGVACGRLWLGQNWSALKANLAGIEDPDARHVLVDWLRHLDTERDLPPQITSATTAEEPSLKRVAMRLRLFQIDAALAECNQLLALSPSAEDQSRVQAYRSFLRACQNARCAELT